VQEAEEPRWTWRPGDATQAGVLGFHVTVLVVLLLSIDLALNWRDVDPRVPWLLVGAGILGGAGALATPRVGPVVRERLAAAWGVIGIGALGLFVHLAGAGNPQRYVLVYALSAVAISLNHEFPGIRWTLQGLLVLAMVIPFGLAGATWTWPILHVGFLVGLIYLSTMLGHGVRLGSERTSASLAAAHRSRELLSAVGRMSVLDPDGAVQEVTAVMLDLGYEMANVGEVIDGMLHNWSSRGFPEGGYPAMIPADHGVAGLAMTSQRTVVIDDYDRHPAAVSALAGIVGRCVAVPLLDGDETLGVLIAARPEPGPIPDDDVRLLEELAQHASRSLTNAKRYASERSAVEGLLDLDRRRGELMANVAHDLRTPVAVIQGAADLLAHRVDQLDPARVADLLARVADNARRLDEMVGTLLELSRLDAADVEADRAPVDLAGLVRDVLHRMAPIVANHPVDVNVSGEGAALGDPPLLAHVFENLLGNAAKHTPPGTPVRVRIVDREDAVRVVVEDDGPGIHPEDLPRLTERFYRGSTGQRPRSRGLGLGLALVARVLAAHGTELQIVSEPGHGARFAFDLPVPVAATRAGATDERPR
jgi:signal transduction histidine kinase